MFLIKKILNILKTYSVHLFLLSFFLIRIPPFIIPLQIFFPITTHILFRIINAILFVFVVSYLINKKNAINFNSRFLFLFLIFLISQALSIIDAQNIILFLIQFERLTAAFIFLLIAVFIINKNSHDGLINKIINIIVLTTIINVLLELFLFFFPGITIQIMQNMIHNQVVEIIILNLNRGRLFFEYYSEISIPIVLYFYFFSKNKHRQIFNLIWLTLLISIIAITFWSNFRGRFFTAGFVFIGFFIIYINQIRPKAFNFIVLLFCLIIMFILANYYISQTRGYSLINRFLMEDQGEDINTIYFREKMLKYSFDIGKSHLLFGVGLDNFYEYLPEAEKRQTFALTGDTRKLYGSTYLYPHNIIAQTFAETGLIGLFSLLFLLLYFLIKDVVFIWNSNSLTISKALIISFWGLVFYALFNPPSLLIFFANLFILRVIIEAAYEKKYI